MATVLHTLGMFLFCSKVTGGQAESDCEPCNLGHYCNGTGRTDVSGPCASGYFCLRGAKIPKPNNDSTGGICPRGSFCEAGKQPEKCAPGTSITFGIFLVLGKPLWFGVNIVHCLLNLFIMPQMITTPPHFSSMSLFVGKYIFFIT